jgi:peptidoglycan/xylan/chitin deacetylase (PgdA/CDA1 family)
MTAARRHHLELVLWSAWGREWTAPDVAEVVARVDRDLAPGTIVLLHDNDVDSPPGTAQRALDALGPIAALLERRGLRGVSLDELVSPS